MEINNDSIFQIDDVLVKDAYSSLDNYEIIFNEGDNVQKDLCAIYFSSNEIYYPNTTISFTRSIIQKNKYEWKNNALSFAYKNIYIRDIQKQWYMEGINVNVNTPKKLVNLLGLLTENFRIYTIGSSAGGFAAMLFGSLLKAERVYAFNAQLDLNIILKVSAPQIDPILFKYATVSERFVYYKTENFILPTTEYFYFQSCKSLMDIEQYRSFSKKKLINRIAFITSNHGFPFLRQNLPLVMSLSPIELKKMTHTETHPFTFAVRSDGFFKTIRIIIIALTNRLKKKWIEKKDLN